MLLTDTQEQVREAVRSFAQDRLAPGALGTGREFRDRYEVPDEANMAELHARLFRPAEGRPPLALRRLKDEVATDLPAKTRRLHPRAMPPVQSQEYEKARGKLMDGGKGAALRCRSAASGR